MTAMFPTQAPSGNRVVMKWLQPGGIPVRLKRVAGDPVPFRWLERIPINTGSKMVDSAVYRIHDLAADFGTAEDNARWTERRMLTLAPPWTGQSAVTLSSGLVVRADACVCTRPYSWEYFSDTIDRFVADYRVDLRFVPA